MACDPYRLTTHGPVIEGLMHFTYGNDYWNLDVRHRHTAGMFTDCPVDEYRKLTRSELLDVLVAIVDLWGPMGSARGDSSP